MRRGDTRGVAEVCAGETLGRGGGSEALMGGTVVGLAGAFAWELLVGATGEERETTALTLELVPFHTPGRVVGITEVGGRTGEFSETGSISEGSAGLAEAESCTICH